MQQRSRHGSSTQSGSSHSSHSGSSARRESRSQTLHHLFASSPVTIVHQLANETPPNALMLYTVVFFTWRKPGLTPTQFKHYYEQRYLPLLRHLAGHNFPLSHTRHYIQKAPDGQTVTLAGHPADFGYDVFSELTFYDHAAFRAFYSTFQDPGVAAQLAADEEQFIDRTKTRIAVVDEVRSTRH